MTSNDGEHHDPMHIRPYVRLPGDEGGTGGGAGGGEAPPAADGPFAHTSAPSTAVHAPVAPEGETTALPDLTPFARQGTADTTELPVISRSEGSRSSRLAAEESVRRGAGSHRRAKGTKRRRTPVTGVFAAAGVVAALGAGLITTQVLSGDRGEGSHSTEDRALDQQPTGAPTHGAPSESESTSKSPSPSASSEPEEETSALPSRTSAPATPRADRNDDGHTKRKVGSSPSASARERTPDRPSPSTERPGGGQERPERPARPGGPTLNVGDSGPAVADLQRRLKQVGYLPADAEEDGVYSSAVQEGVYRYQTTYGIDEDEQGAYGPYTRESLESRT